MSAIPNTELSQRLRQRCHGCSQRSEVREQAALRLDMLTDDWRRMRDLLQEIAKQDGPLGELAGLTLATLWAKP